MRNRLVGLVMVALLAGCSQSHRPVVHETNPVMLSAWSLMSRDGDQMVLHSEVLPYQLNSTLFTDYAHKLRTVTLPEGETADVMEDGQINFPVGTIISKTFFYPRDGNHVSKIDDEGQYVRGSGRLDLKEVRLLETRLLVRRQDGWVALPYVWNDAQTDASLEVAGDMAQLVLIDDGRTVEFPYLVPDQNQCAGCHGTNTQAKQVNPIGPTVANLNKTGYEKRNQLAHLADKGWLALSASPEKAPRMVGWDDVSQPLTERARAYLDVNCGHCHSETGPADTSGLFLDLATNDPVRLGRCKLPIAAGQGTGGHPYSIVPGKADQSILVYRMQSQDPGAMMPELGRSLPHTEGIQLMADWINEMSGSCEPGQS